MNFSILNVMIPLALLAGVLGIILGVMTCSGDAVVTAGAILVGASLIAAAIARKAKQG